jgi:hypothetical protein
MSEDLRERATTLPVPDSHRNLNGKIALVSGVSNNGQIGQTASMVTFCRHWAHSHFPGHAVKSERWEFAICFSKFQRPAL